MMRKLLACAFFIASGALAGCGNVPQAQTFTTSSVHTVAHEAADDDGGPVFLPAPGASPCGNCCVFPNCPKGNGGGPVWKVW